MQRFGWVGGGLQSGSFSRPGKGRGFGQAIASRLAWLAACAFFLYVPSAQATNIALMPSKFSPSTQAACTQSGLDLVCTANPGDQLTFSMAIEVGGDGLSFALQSYEWDEELQDQLDLVEIVHPNGNSLMSPSGTPPVFLQYGSGGRIAAFGPFSAGMQPNTLWESSSQSPGQTGTWWTAAGWTSDTTSAAFAVGISTGIFAGAATATIATVQGALVPALFAAAPAGANNGQEVFLDSTAGRCTLTAPSGSGEVVESLGYLATADGLTTTPKILWMPRLVAVIP